MFHKVLIANRGAIACRVERTLKTLGIGSVAVYSDADRHSRHVALADEAVRIGPAPAAQSYLSIDAILAAARATGAEAIHPGYGFLSENADFADACEAAGIVFIGPTGAQMRAFALKHTARAMARDLGVPLLPGTGLLASLEDAQAAAVTIGYPVMLKSTAGGGGIGIRLCCTAEELGDAWDAVARQGLSSFGDGGAFLERFIDRARHLEVQIFGDGAGEVIALGERDCSAQRRNQKVVEETPAPGISEETRLHLCETAVRLGKSISYRSAGTVEYVYDDAVGEFFFLEVNTRLQVEHGVTEEVCGIDLVAWMVRLASGELPPLSTLAVHPHGHSFEARLYAEDAGRNFQPSIGRLTHVDFPPAARVETWVEPGTEITPYYDPMIAKLIVRGEDRPAALAALQDALAQTQLAGIETNLDYLRKVCASPEMAAGVVTTAFLGRFDYKRTALEVLAGGTQTTVQDFPGRLGYWNIGVPPSGPMDNLALRLANRLVGNDDGAAGLEIAVSGPTLRFGCDAVFALCGALMDAKLDGVPVPYWQAVRANAGATLTLGTASGPGLRAYLAVGGGLEAGAYLGSRSTFMLGGFGGHDGRALRPGDVVHLASPGAGLDRAGTMLAPALTPAYSNAWRLGVLYGPHGSPDFFQDADIQMLFETDWKVHHQSDRTGVRLIGPKPLWARLDGGEAGLHPSNIHDNAYAVGTVDFTGDMPILLGPDGPSLGGFVCPATIVHAELWKMGQLRPGDTVRFQAMTYAEADAMARQLDDAVETLHPPLPSLPDAGPQPAEPAILASRPATATTPAVVTRADGDRSLLVEFGPNVLDLSLRLRVHALEDQLRAQNLKGIIDITPGVRSLQVHYNTQRLPREALLEALRAAEQAIPIDLDISVPSRTLHLPLSWDDPQTRLAAEKYMQSVRPDAPWCPDNIEFIRRINGLGSVDDVRNIIFDASYLVLGLGDVYLGAPVATPVDPRHRLVTTKYNPARTWTPQNAVGIGGAYLCIYGMEGPGGYQLFGRTTQVWNTSKSTKEFELGTPWLLRPFDQIRFYPVTAAELLEMRDAFPHGEAPLEIEPGKFKYRDYLAFLDSIQAETRQSQARQQEAFAAERARWAAAGQLMGSSTAEDDAAPPPDTHIPEGCEAVPSPMASSVWKVLAEPGQRVAAGETLLVLSAMKVEWLVTAPHAGVVEEVLTKPDALVTHGQALVILRRGWGLPSQQHTMEPIQLDTSTLREAYDAGETPLSVLDRVYSRIEAGGLNPVWISLVPRERVLARAAEVGQSDRAKLPLYGVPFAVKDNMDVAGMETTAACPAFAYTPSETATVVRRLEEAGAVLVGKTNMDQFATGLVGVRSPYGACSSVFSADYISGGSSSGSAVAVASGLVSFSLGTDTAGSGRVPAAFNNLVGLKPTRGSLSTHGIVPACRSLDCVSIFAPTSADASEVFQSARGFDPADPYSRPVADAPAPWLGGSFRFGVPPPEQWEFFGDTEAQALYAVSIDALNSLGGVAAEFDFRPFQAAAALLYSGPWVAERLAAIQDFFAAHAGEMHPVVRGIIGGGAKWSAAEAFQAQYQLAALRRETDAVWNDADLLLLPTTGTIYTHKELEADSVRLNSNLGYYTNFVNLLDLAAVALPTGFRANHLPFGVSLIGPAHSDAALLSVAGRLHSKLADGEDAPPVSKTPPGCVLVAVVGAHLTGQPLNRQLTERGARLTATTKTACGYRLYALAGTVPPKPGLVRSPGFNGPGIEVEVWAMPAERFGSFVAEIPAPLGIGSVELADGSVVKGFVCEPFAVETATEITSFGGWRAFLASRPSK